MKARGFTLIELMIAIVIFATVVVIAFNVVMGTGNGNTISYGINGMTEMRCIDGYKFIVGRHGQARQVLDEFGKGAKCQEGTLHTTN